MLKILENIKFNEGALSIICVNGEIIIVIINLNSRDTCRSIYCDNENLLNSRSDQNP